MSDTLKTVNGIDWKLKMEANNDALEAAVDTGSGLVAVASDAENITGTATDRAVSPASMMAALAGLTFPIVTTKLVSLTQTVTSATPATTRLVQSELTVTPATTLAVGSNGSLAAVRGAVTLSSGKSLTDGFLYGVQGKVVATGATIASSPDHIAGLYGQLDMAGATLTGAGHVAAVIGSIQGTPTSSNVDLFYGESVTGNVINSMFKAICKSDYVFDLASNTHTQMGVAGAATTPAGWLKVMVEGVVRYINLWSTAP
jgi:hypothetical protein